MAYLEKDSVVRFSGPARAGRCWPRPKEAGVVIDIQGDAIFVAWEHTDGSVAWPERWLVRFAEQLPDLA